MTTIISGTAYEDITELLFKIAQQIREPGGYQFNPTMLKNHLRLATEGRFHLFPKDWPVWKTVQLGTGPKTGIELNKILRRRYIEISDCANEVLNDPSFLYLWKKLKLIYSS